MFRPIFDDDPFFRDPMQDIHRMMGQTMDMSTGRNYMSAGRRHTEPTMTLSPFGMMSPFGFGGMGSMFDRMNPLMNNIQGSMQMMSSSQGMPGSSFQSSYTSISYGGNGQPQVYQATSSTRVGQDGVKETQKSERNSASGVHKMAIGHHIGDRGHVIEKSVNKKTGDKEESQEFINIEEEQADEFDHEWKQKTRSHQPHHRSVAYHSVGRHSPYSSHHRHAPAAIEYHQRPSSSSSHRQQRRRDQS
ncbi:myeloid leukemia factor 2-like [Clavelina lepadiformis]|uniref:myeloid leukemia factor 2-like n=1 Tax=Clavelina lepadiformis TaxID=159417 RepID=UPI004043641D